MAKVKRIPPKKQAPQQALDFTTEAHAAAPTTAQAGSPWRGRNLWVVLVVVVLAALLRFFLIDGQSVWRDELITLAQANGLHYDATVAPWDQLIEKPVRITSLEAARPFSALWALRQHDQHPPLYLMLLRLWREVFGESITAARALSAVTSVIAVALLFDMAFWLMGRTAAIWATVLMAVAIPQIIYAQEIRPYGLLLLLGMGAASALVRIEKMGPNSRRITALMLCSLLMILTHYFGAGAFAAMGIYAWIALRGRSRWWAMGAMAGAALLFAIVWGPTLWQQRRGIHHPFVDDPELTLMELGWRVLQLPARYTDGQMWGSEPRPVLFVVVTALVTFVIPAYLLLRRRRELLLPYLWVLFIVGLVAGLDASRSTKQLEFIRYTLLASPAFYVLVSSLVRTKSPLQHVLPAAVTLYCLLSIGRAYEPFKEDWRGLAYYLQEHAKAGDLVLIDASGPDSGVGRAAFMAIQHYAPMPGVNYLLATRPPDASLRERVRQSGTVWFINGRLPLREMVPGGRVAGEEPSFRGMLPMYKIEVR